MFTRFDRMYEPDRQTDTHTHTHAHKQTPRHRMTAKAALDSRHRAAEIKEKTN